MKAIYLIYIFVFLLLLVVLTRIKPIQQKLQALRSDNKITQQEETVDVGQLQFGDITETETQKDEQLTGPGFQTLPPTGPSENLAILSASLLLLGTGSLLVLKKQG